MDGCHGRLIWDDLEGFPLDAGFIMRRLDLRIRSGDYLLSSSSLEVTGSENYMSLSSLGTVESPFAFSLSRATSPGESM